MSPRRKHDSGPVNKAANTAAGKVASKVAYDPRTFFESWHSSLPAGELTDLATIDPRSDPLHARFHYNALENGILEFLARRRPSEGSSVLDLGSGAGHWLRFYLEILRPRRLVGVEISQPGVDVLSERFAGQAEIEVLRGDFSAEDFAIEGSFDVVNAIGVMFHVVDDERWRQAIRNLARQLAPKGTLIVSGQFGWTDRDVQFHGRDEFDHMDEMPDGTEVELRVNKRVRSLRSWRRAARDAGLRVLELQRCPRPKGFGLPENNLLFLGR